MNIAERFAAISSKRFALFRQAKAEYEEFTRQAADAGSANFLTLSTTEFVSAAGDPRLRNAEKLYRQALELSQSEESYKDVAVAHFQLGMLLHYQGRFSEAETECRNALNIMESFPQLRVTDIGLISDCCYHMGILRARQGDLVGARPFLDRALLLEETFLNLKDAALTREAIHHFFESTDHEE